MKKLLNNQQYILIVLGLILLCLDYMKTNTFESYGVLLIGLGLLIIWAKRVFWKKMNKRKKKIFWYWTDLIAKVLLFIAMVYALKIVFFK